MLISLLVAAFSLAPAPARELLPSFNADAAAWAATDIIVVSEGEVIDGQVTVLEAWLGEATPGIELRFDALTHFLSEKSRKLGPSSLWMIEKQTHSVEVVTGRRIVLFLARDDSGALRLTDQLHDNGLGSIAWFEEGRAFANLQEHNPGPVGIRPTGATDSELRTQVERTAALHDAFRRIEAFSDPLVRVMGIAPHCHDKRRFVRDGAFEILVASGPSGVAYLRSMALDRKSPSMELTPQVLAALGSASPKTLVATLEEMLMEELDYWTRMELPEYWWSLREPKYKTAFYYRARHSRLLATLRAVSDLDGQEGIDLAPVLDAVAALKPQWETRPELVAFRSSSVPSLCDRILK